MMKVFFVFTSLLAFLVLSCNGNRYIGSLNINVCSYTSKRSDLRLKNGRFLTRGGEQQSRCCDGWTRVDGSRDGTQPCLVPICTKACSAEQTCYKPDTCICANFDGCPSKTKKQAVKRTKARKTQDKVEDLMKEIDDFKSMIAKELESEHSNVRVTRMINGTCPISLPQDASSACTVERQTELTTNRFIYKIGATPDFNDPGRDLDVLVTPTWDIAPNLAIPIAFSDAFEVIWAVQYVIPILGGNDARKDAYLAINNNSIREFTVIDDWRDLFFFFYNYHTTLGNIRTNMDDLVIDQYQDDKVFAEQQIAGLDPFQMKRLIDRPCPRGWKLIGQNCYKLFFSYYHNSFKKAKRLCESRISHLPILSDEAEATKVNKKLKFLFSPVYLDGINGTWADGTPVVGASNSPSRFKKCLTARFTRSGIKLRYRYCYLPFKKVLCQRGANLHGRKMSELEPFINPTFRWKRAIESRLCSTSPYYKNTFRAALDDARIYVEDFPEFRALRPSPDINEVAGDGRTMKPLASPIAVFVSNPDVNNGEFVPVAIQINSTKDSPVFTPDDGDDWTIAKSIVQSAIITTGELLEHLLRTHLVNDPLCTAAKRNLPLQSPLRQLVRQSCRGALTTNKIGESSLLPQGVGRIDILFTLGFFGQNDLINNAFNEWSFNFHDPNVRLKNLGLDNAAALPFFPYRNDGLEIYKVIGDFIRDYIDLYYEDDAAVQNDIELQGWANEIALNATGTPDSGLGKVRDFPKTFTTRAELVDVLHKFVWSASCQHAAVNFPAIEYGTFVPNMPGKYHDIDSITGFSVLQYPAKVASLTQVLVGFNLASLHFDSLFDYSGNLQDSNAEQLVLQFKARIDNLQARIIARNEQNIANGHLSYKYLYPANIPNGISS